ncbi:E3 SUMO-protein ligase ZBED1-like isoform X3 [Labrus mixtus]|uniref:E3 SUMO-protein ligase ZBED1-like isoform X3 n=1 Tax=Labrus mixtus TaxID=508554 RepID=UPI0029C0BCA0|nr:E3 SUMO-protein ligase ZBED1-like isoform X3 [Labrus mixtus]
MEAEGLQLAEEVNKLMINFICDGHHPFSLVEKPAFKELLLTLNPQYKVISTSTLKARIEVAANQMKKNLRSHLRKVSYVATTTDCWTAHQQSFIGVTAHWIDEETLERRSAALACKRLKGSQTFDVLADALYDIHCEYGIREKVVRTTTDSGSNFIKAFKEFGEQSQSEDSESDSSEPEDNGLELPPHQRCACHLLNLVTTTDAAKAKTNHTYKLLSHAAFGKCQAMWNKSGRSYIAAETIRKKCKRKLIRPKKNQWNSTYMAVERIIQIIQETGEDAIGGVCQELEVKMLSPAEIAFLTEYCTVMKPLVKALNILQSEKKTYLGSLLPAIFKLQAELKIQEKSSKMCRPLITAIQNGVQKRFGGMMKDPELIAAAILLPKFKTTWTESADTIKAGLCYVRQELDQTEEANAELNSYLESVYTMNSFPQIKNLSLKLNTGLPASAACERLFSTAALLFTSKRARMNSTDFENQLLLKRNKEFRE